MEFTGQKQHYCTMTELFRRTTMSVLPTVFSKMMMTWIFSLIFPKMTGGERRQTPHFSSLATLNIRKTKGSQRHFYAQIIKLRTLTAYTCLRVNMQNFSKRRSKEIKCYSFGRHITLMQVVCITYFHGADFSNNFFCCSLRNNSVATPAFLW